jgi:hypothetical protein
VAAPLTDRQAEVLRYIEDYIADHTFPPSGRELAEACRLGSPSGAHRMLVLLERKGYLTRSQGVSRGLSVATRPSSASGGFAEADCLPLLALAGWQSVARDAELRMAASTENLQAKSVLIETASARHEQVCYLEAALGGAEGIVPAEGREFIRLALDELGGALPRCESWELFVVDELVCNRVSSYVSEYAFRTRPAVRGLLWRHERLSEQVLARSVRWTRDMLDSVPDEAEFGHLSFHATNLAQDLYTTAQTLEAAWSGEGLSLLSAALDPEEAAALA